MKKCPYCAEEIQDAAIICKHCGRDLAPVAIAQVPVKPIKKKTSIWLIAIAGMLLVCLCAFIITIGNGGDGNKASPAQSQTAMLIEGPSATAESTNTPEPTNTSLPPTATQNPNLIKPGTYLIGLDIRPGIYKGEAGGSCYWARLTNVGGGLDSIIANENPVGQFYVEIRDSDYAIETHCELVPLDSIQPFTGEFPQIIGAGTYIVGRDIQSGTYKGEGDSCYWARLANVAGGLDSIIANDNPMGQFYVQVAGSDFALSTHCQLERVGD